MIIIKIEAADGGRKILYSLFSLLVLRGLVCAALGKHDRQ